MHVHTMFEADKVRPYTTSEGGEVLVSLNCLECSRLRITDPSPDLDWHKLQIMGSYLKLPHKFFFLLPCFCLVSQSIYEMLAHFVQIFYLVLKKVSDKLLK